MIGQRYYTPEEGWIRKDIINNGSEFTVTGGLFYDHGSTGASAGYFIQYGFQQIDIKIPDGVKMIRMMGTVDRAGGGCQTQVYLNNVYIGSCVFREDYAVVGKHYFLCSFEQELPPTKNAALSIRATHGNNPFNTQFHAVDFLIAKERFLLKDNNTYQTITENALATIETDSPTVETFTQSGFTDINQIVAVQSELSPHFDILRYDTTAANSAIKINHLPTPQLIIPKDDISTADFDTISKVELVTTGTTGTAKAVISFDKGATWKSYKDSVWTDCTLTADAVGSNGMTAAELAAIPAAKWADVKSDTIRFAYYLAKTAVTDDLTIDALTITGNVNGIWKKAQHMTDYDYGYSDNQTLQVELLADGSYKINYAEVE